MGHQFGVPGSRRPGADLERTFIAAPGAAKLIHHRVVAENDATIVRP
jgi:hypothetical protein